MISPDSPGAPIVLCAVLALLIGTLTWRAVNKRRRGDFRRFTRTRSTKRRQATYRRWLTDAFVVLGGSSALVLALVWQYVPLLLAAFDEYPWVRAVRAVLAGDGGLGAGILVGVAVLIVGGSVLAVVLARGADAVPAVGDIQSLLPRNRAELRYGALLSINAGIVEELLFRLALPALLYGVLGDALAAVIVSLLMFGALHAYQGWPGVIASTVVGGILMAVYLGTGSIALAIALHAFIDLRSLVLIPVVVLRVHQVDAAGARSRNLPARPSDRASSAD